MIKKVFLALALFAAAFSQLALATGTDDLKFLGIGHSWVYGTPSGQGISGNSYRREAYYRARSMYGQHWTFIGSQGVGDVAPKMPFFRAWGVITTLYNGQLVLAREASKWAYF